MTTTTSADANRDRAHRLVATPLRHAAMITLAGLLLAACSPEPPPAEPTPVPDKARAVEDTLMQAADAQREAIDAAEGGEAMPPEGG